jgi:hypothetical protein
VYQSNCGSGGGIGRSGMGRALVARKSPTLAPLMWAVQSLWAMRRERRDEISSRRAVTVVCSVSLSAVRYSTLDCRLASQAFLRCRHFRAAGL